MFSRLKALLFGSSRDPTDTSAVKLERSEALRAYEAAIARGDTREMHRTLEALTDATTAKLMAEVWG